MRNQDLSTPSEVIYGANEYLKTHGFAKFEKDLKRIKYICQIFEDLGYSHMLYSVDFLRIHTDDAQHTGFDDFIKGVKNLCAMSLSQKLFQEGSEAEIIYTAVLSQTNTAPHSITAEALRKATGTIEYINQILRENDVNNHIGPTKKDPNSPIGLVFVGSIEYREPIVESLVEDAQKFSEEACELFESKAMRIVFDIMFLENKGRNIGIDIIHTRFIKLDIKINTSFKKLIFDMQCIVESKSNRFRIRSSANYGILSLEDLMSSDTHETKSKMIGTYNFVGNFLEIPSSQLDGIYFQSIKDGIFMGMKLTRDELIFCILIDRSEDGMAHKDFNPYLSKSFAGSREYFLGLMRDINMKLSKLGVPTRISMIGLLFSFYDDKDIQLDLFNSSDEEPKKISLAQYTKN